MPIVAGPAATAATGTSATLNGSVNPNGDSTDAFFQYSTDPTLKSGVITVPASSGLTGSNPVPVERGPHGPHAQYDLFLPTRRD